MNDGPFAESDAPRHMPCDMGCQPDWHHDECAIYLPMPPVETVMSDFPEAHEHSWQADVFHGYEFCTTEDCDAIRTRPTSPGHEASRRAEEPAITFGMDEGSQIVFRDQAALDEFVVGARLEGWVPLGTYNDVQLPSHLTFECSADVDDAGLPRWERITTRHAAPVQKGVWRHQDDGTPCVSYPDSFDWNWTEQPFTCSNHGRVMTCVLRPEAQQ